MSHFKIRYYYIPVLLASQVAFAFPEEKIETRPFRNPNAAIAQQQGAHAGHNHAVGGHEHGLETENIFGFTLGSDTEHKGAKGIALENVLRFGKENGSHYSALNKKLEFAYGLTNDISLSFALLAANYKIQDNSNFNDVNQYLFNGFGGEVRYRFLNRANNWFGMTLHLEPSYAFSDELTGQQGVKWGAENKVIFDKELIKNKLFGAFNILHEVEYVKEKGSSEWERGSKFGFGLALTTQVKSNLFIGAEARYLRSYEGTSLNTYVGEALYIGPTLHSKLGTKSWASFAWNTQINGSEEGGNRAMNLTHFERHQVRFKLGYEF